MGVWPGAAAAVAAVAVVAGGLGITLNQHHPAAVQLQTTGAHFTGANRTGAEPASDDRAQPSNTVNPPQTTTQGGIAEQSYATSAAAAGVIDNIQREDTYLSFAANRPTVNLGLGITAVPDSGLGHQGLQWHEGNWTVEVLWYTGNQNGEQIAKNIVAYLHTHMLPAPRQKGVIIVNSTDPNAVTIAARTTIAWQEGTEVYQLTQSGNPVNALTTVVEQGNSGASQGRTAAASFHQTFHNAGRSHQVFLTPTIGFEVTNLGGGASNFMYQFAKTTDGGKTWTNVSTGHYSDVMGVSFINEQTGYLLNNSPAYAVTPDLFVTHNGGATWQEQKLPIPAAFANFYRSSSYPIFFSPTVGFIPVYGNPETGTGPNTQFLYMLITTNGGASWAPYTGGSGAGLHWTLSGQTLTVQQDTQNAQDAHTITVQGLFGNWTVSER
ncbi:hypothetical protein JI721_04320 [Alicyclobacillus cycloheptanicus]|uniref:Uncharacterized protein n=2 Tax=Alicyclobacillus cycloheptanicus TaxID=1457 RepID=A0ABT9XK30_9BACL|nr:hypothetical protein [Alicyclobacillus cycloheptanicus]MDQ0190081.1 hypothetical protein [Alicyclobacillus cycloheptanicus]WDM02058.1 hypothetical protein JI721_04320 [Alicyclobacillus cycloheptanicus]